MYTTNGARRQIKAILSLSSTMVVHTGPVDAIRQKTNLLYKLMGEPKKPEPKAKRGRFREVSYEDVILSTEEMLVKMIQFYREEDFN
jgi:hypothetical protein